PLPGSARPPEGREAVSGFKNSQMGYVYVSRLGEEKLSPPVPAGLTPEIQEASTERPAAQAADAPTINRRPAGETTGAKAIPAGLPPFFTGAKEGRYVAEAAERGNGPQTSRGTRPASLFDRIVLFETVSNNPTGVTVTDENRIARTAGDDADAAADNNLPAAKTTGARPMPEAETFTIPGDTEPDGGATTARTAPGDLARPIAPPPGRDHTLAGTAPPPPDAVQATEPDLPVGPRETLKAASPERPGVKTTTAGVTEINDNRVTPSAGLTQAVVGNRRPAGETTGAKAIPAGLPPFFTGAKEGRYVAEAAERGNGPQTSRGTRPASLFDRIVLFETVSNNPTGVTVTDENRIARTAGDDADAAADNNLPAAKTTGARPMPEAETFTIPGDTEPDGGATTARTAPGDLARPIAPPPGRDHTLAGTAPPPPDAVQAAAPDLFDPRQTAKAIPVPEGGIAERPSPGPMAFPHQNPVGEGTNGKAAERPTPQAAPEGKSGERPLPFAGRVTAPVRGDGSGPFPFRDGEAGRPDDDAGRSPTTAVFTPDTDFSKTAPAQKGEAAASRRPVIAQVMDGLAAFRGEGGRVRLRLQPESLGRVTMEVTVRGRQVDVTMRVENEQVQGLLRGHLGDLEDNLRHQGLQVGSIDIVYDRPADTGNSGGAHTFSGSPGQTGGEGPAGGRPGAGQDRGGGGGINQPAPSYQDNPPGPGTGTISLFA
ncbi:MAG TPA: flagellar hook-length control protein FliK, partial [Syntrophales bacterium]|nr:flagellar hook-length control protein FliK [Syntrophales bacterium]